MTEVPWPKPPREPGVWAGGGPPVAPPGNTALPPLPGPGGVVGGSHGTNPWTAPPPPDGPDGLVPPPPPAPFPGMAARPVLIDRAPRGLVVASIVVVVALVAGLAYVVVKGGRSYPKAWDPRVAEIADWVARERNLDFEHKVEVEFLTPAEYKQVSSGGDAETSAEEQQALDDTVAEFRALGLLEGDVDLGEASDTLSDAGTLAFYSPSTEKVYVRGTKLTPGLRVTLAHELTHVLQDQHFGFGREDDDLSQGQYAALRAVAEGDAERIENRYIEEQLTKEERAAYEKESKGDSASRDEIDRKVPPVMTALFAAPYIFGPQLVSYLEGLGPDGIDKAFEQPPSEEVLWDPRQFGKGSSDRETIDLAPPKGAEEIDSGDFGPIAWYLVLASRLDPKQALRAVDGIGDDGYVVYRRGDDKVCVQIAAEADTPADLAELTKAAQDWAAKDGSERATIAATEERVTVSSCDPGADAKSVGTSSIQQLTLPAGRTRNYNDAIEADWSKEQASCLTDGLVDALGYEQFVQLMSGGDAAPETQQAILAVRDRCV